MHETDRSRPAAWLASKLRGLPPQTAP
jgi:hypothetical protein